MRFRYEAMQPDGRRVVGQIDAPSLRSAHRSLIRRGMEPAAIDPAGIAGRQGRRRKVEARDLVDMLVGLQALVAGGVPLAEALTALAEATEHPLLGAAYGELIAALRRGEKFCQAFARCFPWLPLYIHRLVEAGEMSGRMGEALADAAAQMNAERKLRADLRSATAYPIFLIGFGLAAVLFIFAVVVPRFAVLFEGKMDRLPLLSAAVITAGMWINSHLALLVIAAGVVGLSVVMASRQVAVRQRGFALLLRLPVLRGWLLELETARWAAVLSRLLENRVPLLPSLELARTVLRGSDLQLRLAQVERGLRGGGTLSALLEEVGLLPSTALTLVRVGERSGSLAAMMRSVAQIYEEAVRNRLKTVLTIIEPVAIVLIGGAVGLVAIAVFLAVTSINDLSGM